MISATARTVALVGPFPPLRGGIAHFTERVATELEGMGIDVIRISFSRLYPAWLFPGKSQYEAASESGAESDSDVRPDARAVIDSLNPFTWEKAASEIIRSGVQGVVFMFWHPFFAPGYIRIASRVRKKGVVVSAIVHNALPHERHLFDAMLARRFLRACQHISVLSQAVSEEVQALLPGRQPPEILAHPPYDRFGEPVERSAARARLGIDPADEVVLFFGLVRAYKGLDILLRAMALARTQRPALRLVVAGEFYDDRSTYDALISSLALQDHVRINNAYIPSEEVAVFFGAADAVVQPYRSATQSGILQIATQMGRAVITTDAGGLAEQVLGTGMGLVVPPSDEVALAEAMVRFFSEELQGELEQGAVRARELSDWSAYANFVKRSLESDENGGHRGL